MGTLGFLEYQALVELVEGYVAQINAHTTTEAHRIMATLDESLDQLKTDITTELQQVADALAQAQAAIGDKAAVEAALADAQNTISGAQSRVEGFSADLKADDPQTPPSP